MGIDLHWQDERGTRIESCRDPNGIGVQIVESKLADNTNCVRFIDAFGDTVFNQHQIPALVHELEVLLMGERRPAVREHLERWLATAKRSVGVSHTYLKFVGD